MPEQQTKIAVIGAGVAGIVSAYLLDRKFDVTLIEANDYIGGHTNTIIVPNGTDGGTPIDTGFIVLNDRNYPNFQKFLRQLNVPTKPTAMSFSFHCRQTGLGYASTFPNGVFAQRRNLFRPSFIRMVRDILRFNQQAQRDLQGGHLNGHTLGEYLEEHHYSNEFIEHHLVPSAAAIWSSPPAQIMEFPVEPFIKFYDNHGLLLLKGRPQWHTVIGGSYQYVYAFLRQFKGKVRKDSPVETIQRDNVGVKVILRNQQQLQFDKVVVATHADQALRLLADPSPQEQRLLGAWQYHHNDTILHTSADVMSPNKRVWASWNYIRDRQADPVNPVGVAYYMNSLQGLQTKKDYFVSLNESLPIPDQQVIKQITYTHPNYTFASLATQNELPSLNGQQNTYYCGSYFGYGFHEDAVCSGVAVGKAFDITL